ncbi:Rab3 GTPase-activating protein catalytic subunit [Nymphon striatum]|nr:Rab3 GTPase-activating protein catalytic subunit [Nymphon striatum]
MYPSPKSTFSTDNIYPVDFSLEPGYPNLKYCILYQKLQMLNCCILRKKAREQPTSNETSQASVDESYSTSSDSEAEDEDVTFYECSGEVSEQSDADFKSKGEPCEGSNVFQDSLSTIPEARLRKCGDLKLLNDSKCPIFIPITQEPAPMTEDLLEEHAQVLLQLGTDNEGSQLRARMQSTCLKSDMESFKAANPNSTLEDFVRWYSPRDWIERDVTDENIGEKSIKGHLSARMMIPGNIWRDVWENSKSVPARKQKRLFDDTKEAEKVLHYLSSMSPAQVALNLFPMLIHSSLITIIRQCDKNLATLVSLIEAAVNKAIKISRCSIPDNKSYEDVIKMIGTAETFLARMQSIKSKFFVEESKVVKPELAAEDSTPDLTSQANESDVMNKNVSDEQDTNRNEIMSFIYQLIEGKEVDIRDTYESPVGAAIEKLFYNTRMAAEKLTDLSTSSSETPSSQSSFIRKRDIFPPPSHKEYIFRTEASRPAMYSTPTPQRMHCVIDKSSFRVAGAFSEDTVFQ